jgi:chemotaxis protein MotB
MNRNFLPFIALAVMINALSCVSKKKLKASESALAGQKELLVMCENRNAELEKQLLDLKKNMEDVKFQAGKTDEELEQKITQLKSAEEQIALLKTTNNSLIDQLSSLSVVNKAGAESIKKSLEQINQQSQYIKDLTKSMQYKDSVNLALAINLKRSLSDFNDKDVSIQVKKGVVYISLSDNMLFKSASAVINPAAEAVLSKIAGIINDHKELDILVEGHTDNVPMSTDCVADNWELSAKRAVSVVRLLQNKYKVDPARMTAGGRSEYQPKSSNATVAGKSENRRTEIIILPKLDEFFKLMEVQPTGK